MNALSCDAERFSRQIRSIGGRNRLPHQDADFGGLRPVLHEQLIGLDQIGGELRKWESWVS